jgi:anti-sigma B factor antagonist
MKLSTREADTIVVIELEGSVMGGPDATALKEEIHALVEEKKKHVVVDLSRVQTMNSSGLSMLIGAMTTLRTAGGDLRVAAASKKIESLLVITKLINVFELYPTVKKAVESFSR